MKSHNARDEAGVVAVVYALCVVLLFGVAALGVDLGNAFNRKRETQGQADFAALAGGGFLPAPSTTPEAGDPAVQAVAQYLLRNNVYGDSTTSGLNPNSATDVNTIAAKLVDHHRSNGEVYYGSFDSSGNLVQSTLELTVVDPPATVNFGLATAIGFQNTAVASEATVALKSSGSVGATMPFYAYSGCDYGSQILSEPTSNPAPPALALSGQANDMTLAAPAAGSPNASPNHIDVGDKSTEITIMGTNLNQAVAIGFFSGDGSTYYSLPLTSTSIKTRSATAITFTLSDALVADVVGTQGTYYLRVQDTYKSKLQWSEVTTKMPYLTVGNATLYCANGKKDGNFGSLEVARDDSNNSANGGWLPLNIALGIQVPKVTLTTYTAAITSSSCAKTDPDAVFSDSKNGNGTPHAQTNCLATDTGFPQNPLTNGLITGVPNPGGGTVSRLGVSAGTNGCGNAVPRPVLGVYINNEVLSCYFTDPNVTVGDVSSASYSGDVVISDAIFSSPRFFWIPVLGQQPANGKSEYPIVDYRPAFITGEAPTSRSGQVAFDTAHGQDAVTNGVTIGSNEVQSLQVVFLNSKALPPTPAGGAPVDYDPNLPKLLLLVN